MARPGSRLMPLTFPIHDTALGVACPRPGVAQKLVWRLGLLTEGDQDGWELTPVLSSLATPARPGVGGGRW